MLKEFQVHPLFPRDEGCKTLLTVSLVSESIHFLLYLKFVSASRRKQDYFSFRQMKVLRSFGFDDYRDQRPCNKWTLCGAKEQRNSLSRPFVATGI